MLLFCGINTDPNAIRLDAFYGCIILRRIPNKPFQRAVRLRVAYFECLPAHHLIVCVGLACCDEQPKGKNMQKSFHVELQCVCVVSLELRGSLTLGNVAQV